VVRLGLLLALQASCGRIAFDPGGTRVVEASDSVGFSTSSDTFVDVPSGRVDFTSDGADQTWVILVSAAIGSTSATEQAAEVRYLIDGVERGYGGAQTSAPDNREAFVGFDVLRGVAGPHTVQLQLRDAAAQTSTISEIHLVAFSLPSDADAWFADGPSMISVPAGWAPYLTLDVIPPRPADYLVLGAASISEVPGASNVYARVRDPSGALWPSPDGHYYNHRACWYQFIWARTAHLDAAGAFTIDGNDNNIEGTMRYPRLLAIRTDAFDAIESAFDLDATTTMSTSGEVKSQLTTAEPPQPRDYVLLQNVAFNINTTGFEHGAIFEHDGVVADSYQFDTASAGNTAGVVDAFRSAAPIALDTRVFVSDSSILTTSYESIILALRLRP